MPVDSLMARLSPYVKWNSWLPNSGSLAGAGSFPTITHGWASSSASCDACEMASSSVGLEPSKPERSPSPSVSIPTPSAMSIADIAMDLAFQESLAFNSLSVAIHPIAVPATAVHTAWPGIDPIPRTRIVREAAKGPPNSDTPMYWKFSISAKPRPTVKPTWKPCFGPLM